jgi:membrane protein involved in colicin uptake
VVAGLTVTMVVGPMLLLTGAPSVQASSAGKSPATSTKTAVTTPSSQAVESLRQIQLTDAHVVVHKEIAAKSQARAAHARAVAAYDAAVAAQAAAHAAAVHQAQEAAAQAAAAQAAAAQAAARAKASHAVTHQVVASGHSASGVATWYYWRTGQCASPWLPHGTTVTIRDNATGATATCLVTDTQGHIAGHIIDLDPSVFTRLGPLSAGAIEVTITW